jgi:hypothetical protein
MEHWATGRADGGRCAVREDRGQNRPLKGVVAFEWHHGRMESVQGLAGPGNQDGLADDPKGESWRRPHQGTTKPAASSTTDGRVGRVYASCEPPGHLNRKCVRTEAGQSCFGSQIGVHDTTLAVLKLRPCLKMGYKCLRVTKGTTSYNNK